MKNVFLALVLCAFAAPAFANNHGAAATHDETQVEKTEVKTTKKKMKAKGKANANAKKAVEATEGQPVEGADHAEPAHH